MSFVLGRQTINDGSCADIQQLVQQVQEVVESLGNPGPIVDPDDVNNFPCGEIIGSAYVADVDGDPTVVYVDGDGVCQSIVSGGTPTEVTIVRATANSAVASGDATYAATVVERVSGTASGTITVRNEFGETLTSGQEILAIKINSGTNAGQYMPDRLGSVTINGDDIDIATLQSTNLLVYFELTQFLTKSGTEATGTDVINGGTIWLLDPLQQWMGRAGYSDSDTNAAAYTGFRGYGVKFSTNHIAPWGPTGQPSFRIIMMEGWRRLLAVELAEDAELATSPIKCNIRERYVGVPAGNRNPPIAADTYDLEVYDSNGLISSAKNGDKFLAALRDTDAGTGMPRYEFVSKLEPLYCRIKGTIGSAVARTDGTFTLSSVVAVIGERPDTSVTVHNSTPFQINAPAGSTIYALWDAALGRWHPGDGANWYYLARGRAGFDHTKNQVLVNTGNTEPDMRWREVAADYVITSIDSIELTYPTATSIRAKVNYTRRPVEILATGAGATGNVQGDLSGTACP